MPRRTFALLGTLIVAFWLAIVSANAQPIPEIEYRDANVAPGIILYAAGITGTEDIESCGIMYDVQWSQMTDGRWTAGFVPVGTCDSMTVVGDKVYYDYSDLWSTSEDGGWIIWDTSTPTPTPVPEVANIEFGDARMGATLMFTATSGIIGTEPIESCGETYQLTWVQKSEIWTSSFNLIGTCDSATIVTSVPKVYTDSSDYWKVSEDGGWILKDIPPTPQVAEIEYIGTDETIRFYATNIVTETADVESCGEVYETAWTQMENGRWTAVFSPEATCDSLTVIGDKVFTDNSTRWSTSPDGGWILREPPLPPEPVEVEVYDVDGEVYLASFDVEGTEQLELCGEVFTLEWETTNGRTHAQFDPKDCDSFKLYYVEVAWESYSDFWEEQDGWMRRIAPTTYQLYAPLIMR